MSWFTIVRVWSDKSEHFITCKNEILAEFQTVSNTVAQSPPIVSINIITVYLIYIELWLSPNYHKLSAITSECVGYCVGPQEVTHILWSTIFFGKLKLVGTHKLLPILKKIFN